LSRNRKTSLAFIVGVSSTLGGFIGGLLSQVSLRPLTQQFKLDVFPNFEKTGSKGLAHSETPEKTAESSPSIEEAGVTFRARPLKKALPQVPKAPAQEEVEKEAVKQPADDPLRIQLPELPAATVLDESQSASVAIAPPQALQALPASETLHAEFQELSMEIEKLMFKEVSPAGKAFLPSHETKEEPLVIARGQFADLLTGKLALNLPTQTKETGLFLHDIDPQKFNHKIFRQELVDGGVRFAPLCEEPDPKMINLTKLAIIGTSSARVLGCLQNAMKSSPTLANAAEVLVLILSEKEVGYFTAHSAKRHLVIQQWPFQWLSSATKGIQSTLDKKSDEDANAFRLANLARALTKVSDMRIQVNLAEKKSVETGIPTVTPSPQFVFGNFTLLPKGEVLGQLTANKFDHLQGTLSLRSVQTEVPKDSQILFVSGTDRTLKFELDTAR
jgi:hypothetical protein